MRNMLIKISCVAFTLAAATQFAVADDNAAAGAATGAAVGGVTGAIVGGPVGAAVGVGVGATVGAGAADSDRRRDRVIVHDEPAVRERTCVTDSYGSRTCTEVSR